MPSKKKSSRSNSNLAKSRVKKISVKLPSAENKIHRNKDIPGYKSWKSKADEILAEKQKRKNDNARKGIVRRPKAANNWKTSNKKTSKRHKSLLQRNNLRRLATNVNLAKTRPTNNASKSPIKLRRFMSFKNSIRRKQQNHINKSLSKGPKIFVPKPSKLGKKSSNSNKGKNLVKMQKKRESELNNNRSNYDFVNNAPSKEEAAAASANNQPTILGNLMSGVSKLFSRQ